MIFRRRLMLLPVILPGIIFVDYFGKTHNDVGCWIVMSVAVAADVWVWFMRRPASSRASASSSGSKLGA